MKTSIARYALLGVVSVFTRNERRLMALAAIALVVVVSFALIPRRPSQPVYHGQGVTEWMAMLGSTDVHAQSRAIVMSRMMDTNALPTIIRYLGKRDSVLKIRCCQLLERVHVHFTTAEQWRGWAATMLANSSGLRKSPAAISAFIHLSHDADAGVRMTAVQNLASIPSRAPQVLAALEAAQTDADALVRFVATSALQPHGAIRNSVQEDGRLP